MVQTMLEQESGLKVDRSLSPDEAVAQGAAIYAGMLLAGGKGVKQSFDVQNVSSHDLGVMGVDPTTGRPRRHVMIPRNSPLPCKRASLFKTAKRDQKSVVVHVVEGGTDAGQGATAIGKCVVQGLPKELPQGEPVKVIFKYGSDGRLAVRAELPDTSCDAQSIIERAVGMSGDQINAWSERLSGGLVLEPEQVPDEPADVGEIESLLEDDEGELEFSDDDSEMKEEPESQSDQGTGDDALDDFLKGIG